MLVKFGGGDRVALLIGPDLGVAVQESRPQAQGPGLVQRGVQASGLLGRRERSGEEDRQGNGEGGVFGVHFFSGSEQVVALARGCPDGRL